MESIQTVENFMDGALAAWLSSWYQKENSGPMSYEDIIDGVAIHTVFLQMEMTVSNNSAVTSSCDYEMRLKNLTIVLENITVALEDDVKCIVLQRPDIEKLAMNPQISVAEVELFISLLLSCAVNSPKAAQYINGFLMMDKDIQHELMAHLNNIENIPGVILKVEMIMNQKPAAFQDHYANNVRKAFDYMKQIYQERNELRDSLRLISSTDELLFKRDMSSLNRVKSRVREQQHELEEKTDALIECHRVADDLKAQLAQHIKDKELSVLKYRETKASYEEELDQMSKKLAKLEEDLKLYKRKAKEHEKCQAEIDKLCDELREFQETKEDLEDQALSDGAKIRSLVHEVDKLNSTIDVLADEKESLRKSYQDVLEENNELQSHVQAYNSTILESGDVFDAEEEFEHSFEFKNSTLSEQLHADMQSKNLQQQLAESLHVAFSPIKAPRQLDMELRNRLHQVAECSHEQQHELEELKEKHTKLEVDHKLVQLEKERLQQEADGKKKMEEEFKTLRKSYDELKKLLDQSVSPIMVGPNTKGELSTLERRMSRVQMLIPEPNRVAYLTKFNQQLIAERNSLLVYKDMVESGEMMRLSPEEAKGVVERLKQKNDEMEAEIRNEREANESLQSENAMLKAMQCELEHVSVKAYEEMREKYDELRQQNAELREQFDFSGQKLDITSYAEDNDDVSSEGVDKDRRILRLSMDLDSTRFQADMANKMKENIEIERNQLFKNNRDMSQQIQDMFNRLMQEKQAYFEEVQTMRERIDTIRQKQWIDANVVIGSYKNTDSLQLKKKKGLFEKCARRFSESFLGKNRRRSNARRNSDPNNSDTDKDTNPKTPTKRSSLLVILRQKRRRMNKNGDKIVANAEPLGSVEESDEELAQIAEESGNADVTANLQSEEHLRPIVGSIV